MGGGGLSFRPLSYVLCLFASLFFWVGLRGIYLLGKIVGALRFFYFRLLFGLRGEISSFFFFFLVSERGDEWNINSGVHCCFT